MILCMSFILNSPLRSTSMPSSSGVFRGTDDDYDLVNDFLVFFEKHPDVFVVLLYFYHFGIVLKVQHFQISEVTFEKGGIVLQFLGREHFYAFHINARFVEFLFHQRHEYVRHTYGCLVVLADECVYAGGLPAARLRKGRQG